MTAALDTSMRIVGANDDSAFNQRQPVGAIATAIGAADRRHNPIPDRRRLMDEQVRREALFWLGERGARPGA